MSEHQLLRYLCERIARGEEQAFRELFELYAPRIAAFAEAMVQSESISNEIVDDVFIRLWKRREKVTEIENIKAYLYKAVKNTSLNYIAKKAQESIIEPFDAIHIQLKDERSPESLMISKELQLKIRDAIESLPPRCKVIFKLVREDGLRYKEVAEVLNISENTINAQMVIALGKIREALKGAVEMPFSEKVQKK